MTPEEKQNMIAVFSQIRDANQQKVDQFEAQMFKIASEMPDGITKQLFTELIFKPGGANKMVADLTNVIRQIENGVFDDVPLQEFFTMHRHIFKNEDEKTNG